MRSAYEFLFEKGGYMMYPIAFFAVTTLAIFLERIWYLRRTRILPPGLAHLVLQLISERKLSEALTTCARQPSPLATIFATALRTVGRTPEIVTQKMQNAGHLEAANLQRFIGALATIAGLATLLGLLGTVIGMMGVFHRVAQTVGLDADARTQLLSTGIWEILINTAAGLFIAVTAIVGHGILMSRANRILLDLEAQATDALELLDHFRRDTPAPLAAGKPPAETPSVPSGPAVPEAT